MASRTNRELRCNVLVLIFALIIISIQSSPVLAVQQEGNSPSLELGIIVTSTVEQAQSVIKEFKAGADFRVLAKEKSIDPTADDGGYMGRMSPVQLQPELRDAVNAIHAGQITGVIRTPSGFAVLTILPEAPHTQHIMGREELNLLISSSAVRTNADVGGFG